MKRKTHIPIVLALAGIVSASQAAHAQGYQLSGKSYEMTWPKGAWNGSMGFPKVYCAQAPSPEQAQTFIQAMFNGNAIYVGKILYPDNVLLALVFSSLPPGRTAEEDISKQLADNKATQARAVAASLTYEVNELQSQFGLMVALRMNNAESDSPNTGPFPLARRLMSRQDGALASMSVHRVFAKGRDRFEVAAMQVLPQASTNPSVEKEVHERLEKLVEQLTTSLQECTLTMPERAVK